MLACMYVNIPGDTVRNCQTKREFNITTVFVSVRAEHPPDRGESVKTFGWDRRL